MLKSRAILFRFLVLTVTQVIAADISVSETYHDSKTGLIIHFPSTWRIDPDSEIFTIVSFLRGRTRPRMVLVPLDEAEIEIMAPPTGITTVKDWMRVERIIEDADTRVTESIVDTVHGGRIPSTRVRQKWDIFGDGWSDEYFFQNGGRLYKARAFYRGRMRADYFESVLKVVIENLELEKAR